MRKAITKTLSATGLILASTILTLVVSPAPAGAGSSIQDSSVTVLAGGAEWA